MAPPGLCEGRVSPSCAGAFAHCALRDTSVALLEQLSSKGDEGVLLRQDCVSAAQAPVPWKGPWHVVPPDWQCRVRDCTEGSLSRVTLEGVLEVTVVLATALIPL